MEVFNLLDGDVAEEPRARPGHRFRRTRLTELADSKLTGVSLYELPPGEAAWAYHYELHREEWLLVVSGEVMLRTPTGERVLVAGDVLCFPCGADGAHAMRNDGDVAARFAVLSSFSPLGYAAVYPDSDKMLVVGPGFRRLVPLDRELEYWDGES